jgi:glycosyltransferase involved in cell wall biosynthesis
MKVLQVIDRLNVGGAERVCIDISNLLINENIHVSVLTILEKGELFPFLDTRIETFCLERKSKFNIKTIRKMVSILNNFDIIHIHMRHVYRYVKFSSLFYKLSCKIILHDHFGSIAFDKTIPLFMNNLLKPKFYIGVSNELINWAEEKLKISEAYLLENIIVKNNINSTKQETNTIVHVSNISPIKNQLFSIKLIEKTSYDLVIYGKIKDVNYYNDLKKYLRVNNLENRVSFVHNENNIQNVLGNFKLGLMTSVSESGPLILIEYLAQSLPFVAYKTGQVANILNKELPFFVDDFNLDKWLNKMAKVMDYDSRNLTDYYYKFFNPSDYTNKCIEIYKRIESY